MEHRAWSKARREVGRDWDLNAEVGRWNVEFLSLLIGHNGLNRQNWLTGKTADRQQIEVRDWRSEFGFRIAD